MRLAVSGNGGGAKTTFAETLCRVTGRSLQPVLPLEAHSNSNLTFSLSLPRKMSSRITAVSPIYSGWPTEPHREINSKRSAKWPYQKHLR
jgi:CO dehydrogenase nickel-insertion accessory protein CooC1